MGRPAQTKTDNANLAAKLVLRRHFLDRYHSGGAVSVFEACQGAGLIWTALRRSYPAIDVWVVDLKRRAGRLQVDSERLMALAGLSADVVDIDTYGCPWGHWLALLPHVTAPVTVFLTEGLVKIGGGKVAHEVREGVGAVFPTLAAPHSLLNKVVPALAWRHLISRAAAHGLAVREIVEAPNPGGHARYFGVRLEPAPAPAPGPAAPGTGG